MRYGSDITRFSALVIFGVSVCFGANVRAQTKIFPGQFVNNGVYPAQESGILHEIESQIGNPRVKDSDSLVKFAEFQKMLYLSQDWERFFGRALYYREKIWAPAGLAFQDEANSAPLVLEIMALIKLCQVEPASSVLAATRSKIAPEKVKRLEHFLDLAKKYLPPASSQLEAKNTRSILWPVDKTAKVNSIQDVALLRMKVENVCPSKGNAK